MTKRTATYTTYLLQVILALFVLIPVFAFAADNISISPLIVDEKAKQRDILKQTAVLTNNTERKLDVYITVKNMDVQEGEQEFLHRTKADINTSIANWIEISRAAIELGPGETKRIPYLIQVHLNAEPGLYHAKIYFQEGSTRAEAESRIKSTQSIDINLEVLDDAKERLQLSSFISDQVFFTGKTAAFSFLLENIGNRSVAPKGEIRIFNRRGEEVATLNANEDSSSLLPEATSQLSAVWNTKGKFGRYKAYLDLEYGDKQAGTISDTIFFWVIPWKQILLLFVGFCVILVITAYIIYDRYGLGQRRDTLEPAFQQAAAPSRTRVVSQAVVSHKKPTANAPQDTFSQTSRTTASFKKTQNKFSTIIGATKRPKPQVWQKGKPAMSSHAVQLAPRNKKIPPAGHIVSLREK